MKIPKVHVTLGVLPLGEKKDSLAVSSVNISYIIHMEFSIVTMSTEWMVTHWYWVQ